MMKEYTQEGLCMDIGHTEVKDYFQCLRPRDKNELYSYYSELGATAYCATIRRRPRRHIMEEATPRVSPLPSKT